MVEEVLGMGACMLWTRPNYSYQPSPTTAVLDSRLRAWAKALAGVGMLLWTAAKSIGESLDSIPCTWSLHNPLEIWSLPKIMGS